MDFRSFQEMQKIWKKRQKSLQKSMQKINRKKSEKHAKIMQKSDATPGSLQNPLSDQFWDHFGRLPGAKSAQIRKKGVPKRSWTPLGCLLALVAVSVPLFCPPVSLLERSWRPSGPKRHSWERLLAGPRAPRRLVSAILGAKYPPKRSPGGSQIEVRKRLKLKMAKP